MDIFKLFFDPIFLVIPKIPGVIFNLLIGILIIKFLTYLLKHSIKILKIPADLRGLVITSVKLGLWLMLVIFVTSSLGLGNLAVLISGSAVVLVFFLNNSVGPLLGDIFSGLFLVGDPDFTVGMKVQVNEGKTEGVIHGIDMRKVRLIDDDGKLHVIPNSKIEKGEWVILERKAEKPVAKGGK